MTETFSFGNLNSIHWSLFGVWCLGFGACSLDRLDASAADRLMLRMLPHSHFVIPASLTFLALCPEYFHPRFLFIPGPVDSGMKGDRGDDKN